METKVKQIRYVVYESTLGEIQKIVEKNRAIQMYSKVPLYSKEIDRSDLTQEQIAIQLSNKWHTEHTIDFRLNEDTMYDAIKESVFEQIFNGEKDNVLEKACNKVSDIKVRVLAWFKEYDKCSRVDTCIEIGDKRDDFVYSDNKEEFEKKLKNVAYEDTWNKKEPEYVWLEKFSVGVYSYTFDDIDKKITKQKNKVIRNELTYCIKNNKVIIPDEYINKGKEGIKEWREIKGSSNKNNSMEKKMLRRILADKKESTYDCMSQIVDKIGNLTINYAIPTIEVEGRFNRGKIVRLCNELIGEKGKQEFMEMSKEDIVKQFKKYWKDKLMEAHDAIDRLEIKER